MADVNNLDSMIWLNESDIRSAAALSEWVDAVEGAMAAHEEGNVLVPQRMHLDREGNTVLVMPTLSGERFACKVVSVFPGNTALGLPVLSGLVMLMDGSTGTPLAVLEGNSLTAMRTGAVGAAGIRRTTPDSVKRLGIIGAGVQGIHQAVFACEVRAFTEVRVFDTQPEARQRGTTELASRLPGKAIMACDTAEQLLLESDVIVAATTSRTPVLPDDIELLREKHFIGIGSYNPLMREFPESLFRNLEILFVDTIQGLSESGDLIDPVEKGWLSSKRIRTLGGMFTGGDPAGIPNSPPTFFKSVGGAQFDLATADLVYRNALSSGLGTRMSRSTSKG